MRPLVLTVRALATLLILVLLASCAGVLPGSRESAPLTYLLAPDLPSAGRQSTGRSETSQTLLVSRPEEAAGFGTRRMAYMGEDYRLDYFADHEWVDSPAAMLGPLLVRALRASEALGAVTEDARGIRSDLRLDTVVEALYQDFRRKPSVARVELRVRLVAPEAGRILTSSVFVEIEPAPSDDPYGGVVAINRALTRLLPQIADFAAQGAAQSAPDTGHRAAP
jgi:cholesterol transport system auxiliary component